MRPASYARQDEAVGLILQVKRKHVRNIRAMLTRDEALSLLRQYGGQAPWTAHCIAVANAARAIGLSIGNHDSVDPDTLWTLAVLHDIGRYRTHHPIAHGVEGYRLLHGLGHDTEAFVCASHVGFGLQADEAVRHGLPARDFIPQTLEERIVPLADLLIDGVCPTALEVRTASLRERYADDTEFLQLLNRASTQAASLMAELEARTGEPIEQVVRSVARSS